MSTVLHTHDLHVTIGDKHLCSALNLRVEEGEFWCVLGKNGAGKSTLLHTLAGLRAPQKGSIDLCAQPLDRIRAEHLPHLRGLMMQHQHDAFSSTVLETVMASRYPFQTSLAWEGDADFRAAEAALRRVKMDWAADKDVAHLSGGERQRVALASLLAQDPHLLLLDEPTAHQDASSQLLVMSCVRAALAEDEASPQLGKAAIAACHDINLVARVATHVLVLGTERYWAGPIDEVLSVSVLEAAFACRFSVEATPSGAFYFPRT